jgi:hypothetical protein
MKVMQEFYAFGSGRVKRLEANSAEEAKPATPPREQGSKNCAASFGSPLLTAIRRWHRLRNAVG